MIKSAFTIVFVLISSLALGQHKKINIRLKKQLDSVMLLDQKYRDTLTLLMNPQTAGSVSKNATLSPAQIMNHYWALQNKADSLNVLFIEHVFSRYGYPGKTLVDTPANESAWYIIQHSKKIHQYLSLMKKAAGEKELPFRLYAMMLDRDLMNEGKEQTYGSQAVCQPLKNGKNIGCFIWPIKDAATVNKRRKQAGFNQTVEQNANRLDIVYRIVKLNEVK